jgi:hypothetical protein
MFRKFTEKSVSRWTDLRPEFVAAADAAGKERANEQAAIDSAIAALEAAQKRWMIANNQRLIRLLVKDITK